MSSLAKRMRKNVKDPVLQFHADFYSNVAGSLILTNWILTTEEKLSIPAMNALWKRTKKKGLKVWLDDPNFITETLALFNLKPHWNKFAFVQGTHNCLFLPYEDNKIYTIREDGLYTTTMKTGKIYPMTEPKPEPVEESNVQAKRTEATDKESN